MIDLKHKENYKSNHECLEAEKLIIEALIIWDDLLASYWPDEKFKKCYDLLSRSTDLCNPQTHLESKSNLFLAVLLVEKTKFDNEFYDRVEWESIDDERLDEAVECLKKVRFYENTNPLFMVRNLLGGEISFLRRDFKKSTFSFSFFLNEYHENLFEFKNELLYGLPIEISDYRVSESLFVSIQNLIKDLLNGRSVKEYLNHVKTVKNQLVEIAENKQNLDQFELKRKYKKFRTNNDLLLREYLELPTFFKKNEEKYAENFFSRKLTPIESLLIMGIEIQHHIKFSFFADELDHIIEFRNQLPLIKFLADFYFEIEEYKLAFNQYEQAKSTYFEVYFPSEYYINEYNRLDIMTVKKAYNVPNDLVTNKKVDLAEIVKRIKECLNKLNK
jgi:hypothetical protein